MKKIFYAFTAIVVLLVFNTDLSAATYNLEEIEKLGEHQLTLDLKVTDNIYVVGNKIFTNYITIEEIENEGKTVDDVIKYDTVEDKWSYINSSEEVLSNLKVTKINDELITIDYIYSKEELIDSVLDTNIKEIVLMTNIKGVSEPLLINRDLVLDGQNHTIEYDKIVGDEYCSNTEAEIVSYLCRYNFGGISIVYGDVTIKDIKITKGYIGIYSALSNISLVGNIDLSGNEIGLLLRNTYLDNDNATITNTTETRYKPTIMSELVNNEEIKMVSKIDDLYYDEKVEIFDYTSSNEQAVNGNDMYSEYYLNKENAEFLFGELSFDKAIIGNNEYSNGIYVEKSLYNYGDIDIKLEGLSDGVKLFIDSQEKQIGESLGVITSDYLRIKFNYTKESESLEDYIVVGYYADDELIKTQTYTINYKEAYVVNNFYVNYGPTKEVKNTEAKQIATLYVHGSDTEKTYLSAISSDEENTQFYLKDSNDAIDEAAYLVYPIEIGEIRKIYVIIDSNSLEETLDIEYQLTNEEGKVLDELSDNIVVYQYYKEEEVEPL